ncbi:hypothetical protein E2C01_098799 [Portunus trituberculatus]|uniref:Uncharacterized protein n=1 Tax=Portunus trituberculatus TaxID=210409 RepID=A0A5B7K959_PORTR|nr:hypothetical protein [Portunus trituberculatus]
MPHDSPCGSQGAAKFEFKLPNVYSMVRRHPTAKNEFRPAEIRLVQWFSNVFMSDPIWNISFLRDPE